ncbi:hypothetical protein KEM52_002025 [Ascosphaera acerosa]|nr:hypothetical protein KEM52_002025 [Ascosphaera acerosa]
MGSFRAYLTVYVLGGVTFVPLVLVLAIVIGYLTLPTDDAAEHRNHAPQGSPRDDSRAGAEDGSLAESLDGDGLPDKFKTTHESDVAAGYFAVLREYAPRNVSWKVPERNNSPPSENPASESPSVYQSVYRSIFERKTSPTIEPTKEHGKASKKSNSVFYVVIRHGHLLLYDNAEQIDVRYVISLAQHRVSISAGDEPILEGELWSKRTAICLTRVREKQEGMEKDVAPAESAPFFFFTENGFEKEDFYFAILANMERKQDSAKDPPTPLKYDVKDIITLVQKLHSTEEQLQTRWLNALIGRWFLAIYRTEESKLFIRKKIEKKLSRIKKPNFLTRLSLEFIDLGNAAPLITEPRLKDLTVDGGCCVQFDLEYTGDFKAGLAATARIDLGPRIKAREVDMLLAVTVKKWTGPCLLFIKPPPSNRMWFTFSNMPEVDLAIEPIVSSRQITYGFVLRAIENKIREAIAETLVTPFWDDIPFLNTEGKPYRGGIWELQTAPSHEHVQQPLQHAATAPAAAENAAETSEHSLDELLTSLQKRTDSESVTSTKAGQTSGGLRSRKSRSAMSETPQDEDGANQSQAAASGRKPSTGADGALAQSPSDAPAISEPGNERGGSVDQRSDASPGEEEVTLPPPKLEITRSTSEPTSSANTSDLQQTAGDDQPVREEPPPLKAQPSPHDAMQGSTDSVAAPVTEQTSKDTDGDAASARSFESRTPKSQNQRHVMESLNSAAAAAKKWSLNVLNRKQDGSSESGLSRHTLNRRGSTRSTTSIDKPTPTPTTHNVPPREIPPPPPGVQPALPPRTRSFAQNSTPIKRKPVPPPFEPASPPPLPQRPATDTATADDRQDS